MIVTTSSRPTADLEQQAQAIAQCFNSSYVPRQKRSIAKLQANYGDLILVSQEGVTYHPLSGEVLRFHPDTAMLRLKAPSDPLVSLVGTGTRSVLDCTMGLASDTLVLAAAGHEVIALESEPIIHFIVSHGLATYHSGNAALDRAMRSIQTVRTDALTYLRQQAERSVDVIYLDPMFSETISESQNLSALNPLANHSRVTEAFMREARRVAREKIIIKAHFRDTVFEDFGFDRQVRPNQKFHYGVVEMGSERN